MQQLKLLMLFTITMAFALVNASITAQEVTQADVSKPQANVDESAIRIAIDSYVKNFNKGDAKALATHWSKEGKLVTSSGYIWQGHTQLEEGFAEYFRETIDAKLELAETTISFLSPNVAVEAGIARVVAPEQEPSVTIYEAIHIKTVEGWKIDSVSEQQPQAIPTSHHEQLKRLQWMVGSWVDSDEGSSIESSCRWTTNQNFLTRTFKVVIADQVDFEGTQVIGWDPSSDAIRSWTFDSDGGFGVGRWAEDEGSWTVRTLHVLPDGKRASSTNIYTVIDESTVQFRSIGRQVDGELLPSIEPVTVSRLQD